LPADIPESFDSPDTPPDTDNEDLVVAKPRRKRRTKAEMQADAGAASIDLGGATSTPAKKRKTKGDLGARQIQGIHAILAQIPGLDCMMLADEEAAMLAQAMAGVAAEYDIEISGKTGAIVGMVAAVGMIYVPRAIHVVKSRKKKPAVVPRPPQAQETAVAYGDAASAPQVAY
jgi:hypothetical protein